LTLRPQDVEALRAVAAALSEEGWPFVIIGARAPWILLEDHTWRATRDVDAVVRAPTWDAFERLAGRLKALGFSRPALHHFVSPDGAEVDLLPYGEGVVANDAIVWPDGVVMSALGLEEAFAASVEREVASGLHVRVVTAPALVVLKVVAYQDRPHERGKDVGDAVDVFERYEEEDGRRFEAIGVTVDDGPITFEEAGAYLVGVDAARLARPRSREVIRTFLAKFTDEYAEPVAESSPRSSAVTASVGESRSTDSSACSGQASSRFDHEIVRSTEASGLRRLMKASGARRGPPCSSGRNSRRVPGVLGAGAPTRR
jgi:predicted nucleotidyltransferase